jgi:hypothetical protein
MRFHKEKEIRSRASASQRGTWGCFTSAVVSIELGTDRQDEIVDTWYHYSFSPAIPCRNSLELFFHDFEHTFHVSAHALVPFERVTILRR